MPLDITCSCGRTGTVSPRLVGRRLRCRGCGRPLRAQGPRRAASLASRAHRMALGLRDALAALAVALLLLAAVLAKPALRALAPQRAVHAQAALLDHVFAERVAMLERGQVPPPMHDVHDPWRRPWCIDLEALLVYSAGPDGIDDGGAGDDVVVFRRGLRTSGGPAELLLAESTTVLASMAVALGLSYALARRLPPCRTRVGEWVALAACGLLPPALLPLEVHLLDLPLLDLETPLPYVLLPLPLATLGGFTLLCLTASLLARQAARRAAGLAGEQAQATRPLTGPAGLPLSMVRRPTRGRPWSTARRARRPALRRAPESSR